MNRPIEDTTVEMEVDLEEILTARYVFGEYFSSGNMSWIQNTVAILENPNFGSSTPDSDLEKMLSAMKPTERAKLLELLQERLFLPPVKSGEAAHPKAEKGTTNRRVTLDKHIGMLFAGPEPAGINQQPEPDFDIDVEPLQEQTAVTLDVLPHQPATRPQRLTTLPSTSLQKFRKNVNTAIAAAAALLAIGTGVGVINQQSKKVEVNPATITSLANNNSSPSDKLNNRELTTKTTTSSLSTSPSTTILPPKPVTIDHPSNKTITNPVRTVETKQAPATEVSIAIKPELGLLNSIKSHYKLSGVDLGIVYRQLATTPNKADGFRNFIKLLEQANLGQDVFNTAKLNIPENLSQLLEKAKNVDAKQVVGQTRKQIQQIQQVQTAKQPTGHTSPAADSTIIDLGNITSLEKQAQTIIPQANLNLPSEQPAKSFFAKTTEKVTGFFKKLFG